MSVTADPENMEYLEAVELEEPAECEAWHPHETTNGEEQYRKCGNDATHICKIGDNVAGKVWRLPYCDECGKPGDVEGSNDE